MKYYYIHETIYQKMRAQGAQSWNQFKQKTAGFDSFCQRPFLETSLTQLPKLPQSRVLDIGCGTGPLSCFLAQRGFTVTGIDVSATAIEMARENATAMGLSIDFKVADICDIAEHEKYDLIVDGHCLHCIVYEQDRKQALGNIFQLLKTTGYFLLETMTYKNPDDCKLKGTIDEKGIVWSPVEKDFIYEKKRLGDIYHTPTRRIVTTDYICSELIDAGFTIIWQDQVLSHPDEPEDFQAICQK